MTIAQLIARLQQEEDQSRTVILSSDSEGNSYSLLSKDGFNACAYKKDGYDIEIGLDELTPEKEDSGYGPDDVLKGGKPALVLYP